ncbi:MAG: hypothetical protein ABSF13_12720 [Smithella sp.]|jgi:hypothetical protein
MIDKQTVLILGAGASNPYGFPTGAELRDYIFRSFPKQFVEHVAIEAGPQQRAYVLEKAEEFASSFHKSSTPSIDLFLARNKDLSVFGKKAIAVSIMEHEKISRYRENIKDPSTQDWYSYLYKRMTEKLITPESYNQFGDNKITFITFNYDRSLEYFIEDSLLHSFLSADPQKKRDQFEKIKMHHVYGCIDKLPSYGGKRFGAKYNSSDINRCSQNIKIVHETLEMNNEVQEIIKNAERILFLGFGYAEENLQALGIGTVDYGTKKIYGTSLGLTERETNVNRSRLAWGFSVKKPRDTFSDVKLMPVNNLTLLKEYL